MFLSFVVATYNCGDRVSVLRNTAQALRDFPCEFCVSDGGSRDGTVAALSGLPNVRVVRSAPDRGIYDAWNHAVEACQGEYLSFIGVDDEPQAAFLEAARKLHEARGPLAFIYGDALLRSGDRFRRDSAPSEPQLFLGARPCFDVPHPGALNHRSLFASERFDPSYRLAGDLHFYLRARDEVRALGHAKVPEVQAIIEAHGVSRSAKAFRLYRGEYARIEAELGIRPGYSELKLRALGLLERAPRVFDALKWASWQLRGEHRA